MFGTLRWQNKLGVQSLMGCLVGAQWINAETNADDGGLACEILDRSESYQGYSCDLLT